MQRTRLSSKGQVVLPKSVREQLRLSAGTEFIVTTAGESVVLRRATPFAPTHLADVAGRLRRPGPPRSVEDMDAGIRRAVAGRNAAPTARAVRAGKGRRTR